jgi:hypothetical protein
MTRYGIRAGSAVVRGQRERAKVILSAFPARVWPMSVTPPKADIARASGHVREVPEAGMHLSFSLRQRPRDFAGALDEELRDGAERAVLQGDDSSWHAGHWQLNGQDLELWSPREKSQHGRWENREKPPGRQETHPHLKGNSEYTRGRIIDPAGAKGFHKSRPKYAFPGRQRPGFVH